MSYWQMDDGFIGHHKTKRAMRSGLEALLMWIALRTYVAKFLTDGFIPDSEIDTLDDAPKNPRKWLKVLVDCGEPKRGGEVGPGLIEQCDGGWLLHDFFDHAETADEINRRKEFAKNRKRLQREREKLRQEKSLENLRQQVEKERQSHEASRVTGTVTQRDNVTDVTPGSRVSHSGTAAIPSHPIPSNGEINPLPPKDSERRPRPKDPMNDSLNGKAHWQRADVASVFDAWKAAVGMTEARREHYSNPNTESIADAIDANGIDACMLVAKHCMRDRMVNGEADEHKNPHKTTRYIFGNQETFQRILTEARKLAPETPKKSVREQMRELGQR